MFQVFPAATLEEVRWLVQVQSLQQVIPDLNLPGGSSPDRLPLLSPVGRARAFSAQEVGLARIEASLAKGRTSSPDFAICALAEDKGRARPAGLAEGEP